MINLLPEEKLLTLRADYEARRFAVGSALFFSWLVVAAVVAGSVYLSFRTERLVLVGQLESASSSPGEIATSTAGPSLGQIRADVIALTQIEKRRLWPSSVLEGVLSVRPPGVRLLRLALETEANQFVLNLSGLALSRTDLLNFVDRLKRDEVWATVDSPVSNLIKDKNVEFTLKLTLKDNHE